MNRGKAFEKIRKCLALAESGNEHEAAAALRQAKAIMKKFNLECDLSLLSLSKAEIETEQKQHPKWAVDLAVVVARAFECSVYSGRGRFIFVGEGCGPEVAMYSHEVLYRQLKAARKNYISNVFGSVAKKRKAGRAFCEGWVFAISGKVREFANPVTDKESQDHTEFLKAESQQQEIKNSKQKKSAVDRLTASSAAAGLQAGKEVELNHGVSAGESQLRVGVTT